MKAYFAAILLQFTSAASALIAKSALNHGMNHFTFSVYRNLIATLIVAPFAFLLERKIRPAMTFSITSKIMLLALLEPVIDQNLYYTGMKYTTATFAMTMCNVVPAITFLLAWALRIERVNIRRISSQVKIVGTIVTLGGAMIMTLVRGSVIGLPWTKVVPPNSHHTSNNSFKGPLMVAAGCFCWSCFYILQAITLKSYPAALSLTGLICMMGAVQGAALTLVAERGNFTIWSIGWDSKLLAYAYSGLISSGVTYYVTGLVIKGKGPVFVTSFNPLSMVIVALMSSFIFAEKLDVGKVTGAVVIVIGLYLVIWGKAKDHKEDISINSQSELVDEKEKDGSTTKTCSNDNKDSAV